MSHSEMEQQVALLAGGELGARETEGVERHLTDCAECRQLAAELRETRELLAGLGAEEPDERAVAAVRTSVLAAAAPRRWPLLVAVAAALVIAIAIGSVQQLRRPAPVPMPVAVIYPPEAPVVRHTPKPAPEPVRVAAATPSEPMVIKIVTDDPDVVIYWLVEGATD